MTDLKLGIVFDVKNGTFKSEVKNSAQVIEQFGASNQQAAVKTRQFNTTIDDTNTELFKTNKVASGVKNAIAGLAAGNQQAAVKTRQFNTIIDDTNNALFKINKIASGVKNSIAGLAAGNQQAAVKTRQFNAAIDDTNTTLFKTNKVASGVKNAIAGLAAGFGAVQLGKGLVTELAAFQDIRTRLQGLSVDAADYANKERWLIDLAAEHHKELNGLADGYSRLSTLTQEKIITDGQARDMLEGLSNAAAQNGASSADLERVYYGLAQALGQGVVQMQEVNQVVEPLPGLMTKLARAAGEETGAGFKALIASGEVTSEMFGGLLVTALAEYEGAAARTADNINAKYRDIKLEYQLLAVELEQPIESALLPTLDGLAQGLSFLRNHTEAVITVLQGALVIAAGHATNAIITKTAATAKELIASRSSAIAAKTQAQSEYNLALAYKASAVGSVQNEIADKRLIATRTTLTAATAKLSVANKTLGLMSGIVGGLPGLLTIAGFAMYSFATSTGDAADEAKRLNEENNKLNPFANYTFETATGALQRYKGQLELAQQMADETQTRFKNPFFKNVTAGDVTEANKEVERLTKTIEALQTIVNDKSPEKKKPEAPVTQSGKVLDVFKGQEDALNRQLALLGQTTELAKAEYETQQGKYKDLLPGQKATIINLATEIDKKKASIDADKQAVQQADRLSDAASSYAETLQRKISISDETTNVQQLNYELEHGSLVGINEQLKEQLLIKAQLADQAVANAEQQLPFWEQMKEHIGSTSEQFDVMWGNTFDRFAQGIGETTASAIIEGENFSDSMKAMTRGAIQSVLAGLVEIGVKKLTLAAIDKVTAKTTAASAGGVMIAQAQAMALMSGLNAYSSTAAIPITGAFAAPGAMAAALAITEPMAATIGGLSSGMIGMAHDGIDSIPNEGTWLLDKGERVVDSRTNADLKNYLGGNTQGSSQSDVTVQFNVTATDTGGFSQWYRANRNMIISDVSDAVRSPA